MLLLLLWLFLLLLLLLLLRAVSGDWALLGGRGATRAVVSLKEPLKE